MVIWFAVTVPIVTALVLRFRFNHRTVWWEFLVPVCVSVILIAVFKGSITGLQTLDTEYWGGWVVRATYDEAWTEKRTRKVKDSNDKERTEEYHVHHPPEWAIVDSNGQTTGIDKRCFEDLCGKFGNRKFQNLFRADQVGSGGDRYVTTWNGKEDSFTPATTTHWYENRVQASASLLRFDDVSAADRKTYGLFDYPEIVGHFQCPSILGNGGPTQPEAERLLTIANAKLGKKKEVRLWILLFKNQPLQAAFLQQNLWQGGNKNEFILAIGTDNEGKVEWCHPISWTEVEDLKIDARNAVLEQKGQPLDLVKVARWLTPEIEGRFIRKRFSDFSYLTVEPPLWAVILTFLATVAANGGLSYWIVTNEFRERGT